MKILDYLFSNKVDLLFVNYVMKLTGIYNPEAPKKKLGRVKAIIRNAYADSTFRRVVSEYLLTEVCKIRQEMYDAGDYSAIESKLKSLEDRFMNLEVNAYTINEWEMLSLFFKCNCLFKLGYICREKSKELVYLNDERSMRHIRALVEDRRYDEAQILMNKLRGKKSNSKIQSLKFVQAYINAMRGERFDYNCDCSYREYIQGKKILIIGPTIERHALKKVPFLKDADAIIRNNVMLSNISQGIKIDISYYNSKVSQIIKEEGLQLYTDVLDWLAFKRGCDIAPRQGKIHKAPDAGELMYAGIANVLPIMVADLMFHGADKIYVCGNNLYLGQKTHSSDYVSQPSKNSLLRGFVVHDLASQHIFLKTMFDSGIIVADAELSNVLKLPTIDYLKSIEFLYF